jgi:carboxylesterase type B
MFFIQGGGLNEDSNPNLNGSQLIEAADFNMIVVTHNYRVGTFGFLASKEIQANGNINNGFLDQRKALQWVQDHIDQVRTESIPVDLTIVSNTRFCQFGGDPGHVVLSGDSAGAQSITVHLTAFGGAPTNLFHGVIAESQSFPPIFNVSFIQFAYDALVNRTGCTNETDTLACLRGLDIATLQNASIAIPYPGRHNTPNFLYGAIVDGSLIPDIPYNLFLAGKFVDVPSVFG